jgi:hypothetical protein
MQLYTIKANQLMTIRKSKRNNNFFSSFGINYVMKLTFLLKGEKERTNEGTIPLSKVLRILTR